MYKWHFNIKTTLLFPLSIKDSIITGIDFNADSENIRVIKSSNFFSYEFIKTYKKLENLLDLSYKKDSARYNAYGEIPPYGPYDFDIFCNCQDSPDTPYVYMFFEDLKINNGTAKINWGWNGGGMKKKADYYVMLKLENSKWKITNLMGFDDELKQVTDKKLK